MSTQVETTQPSTAPSGTPTATPSSSGGARVQLKRALAGQDYDVQRSQLTPVQRAEDTASVHEAAARGTASGGGALPHGAAIQQAFGSHDISNVQAHTGGAASEASAAMGAEAYASGDHIAFGSAPDLHTAAHEAAHVVQQRAGVSLSGGVGQAGDSYEKHADAVADAVVQGKSAEGLLSQQTGGAAPVQQKRRVGAVQHKAAPAAPTPTPNTPPGS